MKAPACLILLGLLVAGCDTKPKPAAKKTNTPPASSSSGNPLTAPVDYLGAASRAQQTATKVVSASSLQQAIQMFYAQEGRYPKDLNELVSKQVMAKIPPAPAGMKYQYDPAKGEVKVVKQ